MTTFFIDVERALALLISSCVFQLFFYVICRFDPFREATVCGILRPRETIVEFGVYSTTYIGYSTLHAFGAWTTVLAEHVVPYVFSPCVCVFVCARLREFGNVSFLYYSSSFSRFQLRKARVTERATNGRVSHKIHTRYVFSMRCQTLLSVRKKESNWQMLDQQTVFSGEKKSI